MFRKEEAVFRKEEAVFRKEEAVFRKEEGGVLKGGVRCSEKKRAVF